MSWARIWFRDIRGHTATLGPLAFGAYVRLLFDHLARQAPLLDDARTLRRIAGVSAREWDDVRAELADVYELVDGYLHDRYADALIRQFLALSEKKSRNAKRRYHVVAGDSLKDEES